MEKVPVNRGNSGALDLMRVEVVDQVDQPWIGREPTRGCSGEPPLERGVGYLGPWARNPFADRSERLASRSSPVRL